MSFMKDQMGAPAYMSEAGINSMAPPPEAVPQVGPSQAYSGAVTPGAFGGDHDKRAQIVKALMASRMGGGGMQALLPMLMAKLKG